MSIWKPISGYEGLYEVSDKGEIKSLRSNYGKQITLKQCVGSSGYLLVTLCNNGKQKTVNVHRIVAQEFVPNPSNLPCVNHRDENRRNNNASNLEWCSYYQNNIYGQRLTKSALKRGKPVICIETKKVYPSASAAQREVGIHQSKISACCIGKRKSAGKLHWAFI